MNYTSNYRLPQWEKSDRVLMEDFNQAMGAIEAGIADAAGRGDSAGAAAHTAQTSANQAQSTADAAVSKADAAQSAADRAFRPGYMPYATGLYVGNGATLNISLGFKPSLVIITAQPVKMSNDTTVSDIALAGAQNNLSNMLKLTATGITVVWDEKYTPCVNRSGYQYSYIAFR